MLLSVGSTGWPSAWTAWACRISTSNVSKPTGYPARGSVAQAAVQLAHTLREQMTPDSRSHFIFVAGPMMSGKSLVAIEITTRSRQQGPAIAMLQPCPSRPEVVPGQITSRSGHTAAVTPLTSLYQLDTLPHRPLAVVVDEVQFTPEPLQAPLLHYLRQVHRQGAWVISLGLLYTSLRRPFPFAATIQQAAEQTHFLQAICSICGRHNAIFSQRFIDGRPATVDSPNLLPHRHR